MRLLRHGHQYQRHFNDRGAADKFMLLYLGRDTLLHRSCALFKIRNV